MRTYIVSMFATLDGFSAGPGADLTVLPFDPTFNDHNLERLRAADTLVVGATSFRDFVSYWPAVADDPTKDDVEREISRLNNAIEKVVVSDSLTPDDLGVWRDTTRIVGQADAAAEVRRLKEGEGGDIITFGSSTTWGPLLAEGVVDELYVMIGAGLLGVGVPIVGPEAAIGLRLLGVERRDGSDNIVVRYAPIADTSPDR